VGIKSWNFNVLSTRAPIHHRAIPLAVLLATTSMSAQAPAQALQSDEQSRTIHGTVVNAATKAPIGRALVSSADNRFATLTDGEGHFEFSLPKANSDSDGNSGIAQPYQATPDPVENLWLTARKPGFLDNQ